MVALKLIPPRGTTTPAPTPAPKPTPAPTPAPKPTPAPAPAPKPTTTSPLAPYAKTTLRKGSTGAAVTALQKALGITADGAFGPQTEAAVKAYQARRNLPATGIVAASTWAALMGQATTSTGASRSTTAPRPTTAYTPLMSTTLQAGAKGNAVKALQRALGGLVVDGAYGARTVAAVKAFQTAHHLPATGVTDTKVWQALEARDYPLRAYYSTVLRSGSRGAAVVALQRALRIPADGAYGAQTTAAVKALQGRAKLARTGVVATLTWQALEAELRRR
jgi:peptidoglycan hydrolase-like protein with peptidoglycan-binding domain